MEKPPERISHFSYSLHTKPERLISCILNRLLFLQLSCNSLPQIAAFSSQLSQNSWCLLIHSVGTELKKKKKADFWLIQFKVCLFLDSRYLLRLNFLSTCDEHALLTSHILPPSNTPFNRVIKGMNKILYLDCVRHNYF